MPRAPAGLRALPCGTLGAVPPRPGVLRIADREFSLASRSLGLVVSGSAHEMRTFLNFEARGCEAADGWRPKLDSASFIPLAENPLFRAGAEVAFDVPVLDEAGSSFNLMLYVFEHAGVRDGRIALKTLVAGRRVHLGVTGRADVHWDETYGADLAIELAGNFTLDGISVVDAKSEPEALAILKSVAIPTEGFTLKQGRSGYHLVWSAR